MPDSQEWGRSAEDIVQREYENRGYRLIRKRWRTPVAEIDLVMASLSEYVIIEVKRLSKRGFAETRVSRPQKQRLRRAQMMLQDRLRADVRLVLAFVQDDDKILFFNLTADDLH